MTGEDGVQQLLHEGRIKAERQQANFALFEEELSQLEVSGSNKDDSVFITLDHRGGLLRLRLSDEAMRRSGRELSEDIMRGVRSAQRHLARKVDQLAARAFGEDSSTRRFVAEGYRGVQDGGFE